MPEVSSVVDVEQKWLENYENVKNVRNDKNQKI